VADRGGKVVEIPGAEKAEELVARARDGIQIQANFFRAFGALVERFWGYSG